MNRTWIVVGTISAAALAVAGCRSSAPETAPAPAGASSRLTQPAPSVQEIEKPLRTASAMPAYVQGAATSAEPEAAAATPRVAVMPPVEPGRQPGVVESVVLSNEELHGYAFPGVGTEIPPTPNATPEVLKAPAPPAEPARGESAPAARHAAHGSAVAEATGAAPIAARVSEPEPVAPAPVEVPRGDAAPASRHAAHGSAVAEASAPAPIVARVSEPVKPQVPPRVGESSAPSASDDLAAAMWAEDITDDSHGMSTTPAAAPVQQPEPEPAPKPEPVLTPAPVVVEPAPAPVVVEPAPAPVVVEPAPVPVVVEPAPAPAPSAPVTMQAQAAPAAKTPETALVLEEAAPAPILTASAPAGVDGPTFEILPPPDLSRYEIGPGDILDFQSYNDVQLAREVTVRYDGQISLPLISDVQVGGHTRDEAEALIRAAYDSVFRNPQVSLLVKTPASKSYTVVGDIATPGVYPYTRATTLIDAISVAGGLRPRNSSSSVGGFVGITGQLTKAFIIRKVNGERRVVQYDLRGLGHPGAHASETPVYFGDLIYIPEGVNLVYVLGESRNPVIVELTEGMTMLQLLSLSGGFNESTARLRSVVLMRQVDGDHSRVLLMNVREMLRTGKDFSLNPGDIVYIPRKYMVRIQEFIERFTGSISPVLNLYTDAVNAYYTKDLNQQLLEDPKENRTLQALANIEQFGASTSNITELYRRP